ncbi:MAG: tRNA pseudouridine synthase A [Saprospiraceae bacterium]|nr:tRNA pseudouridine synthase A [Saprospiraceae bacterium]
MRLALQIQFDGTQYAGWQKQAQDLSVQQKLEEVFKYLCQVDLPVTGCGRTDAGVHAKQFMCHLDLPGEQVERISTETLNRLLPGDISVDSMWITPDAFNSRFDAHHRKYIYRISYIKNPFKRIDHFYYRAAENLDLIHQEELSDVLLQLKDFKSFAKSNSGLDHFICHLTECRWKKTEHGIEFHIAANRFVRGMVRLVVGTFLNLAQEKISLSGIQEAIQSGLPIPKAWSVPACGLTLEEVTYPKEIRNDWRELK